MSRFALILAAALPAFAQQLTPHAGYIYPAGGRTGATFECTIGGQFLNGPTAAFVSGSGVEAKVVEYYRPLNQGEFNKLRDELEQTTDKTRAAEIRQKMATFIRRPVAPQLLETVRLQIAVSPNAAPGRREIRINTALGLTNPLAFQVGQLPEYTNPPAKPADELSRVRPRPAEPVNIALPAVVNGQIISGVYDRYRFHAQAGQRLVISAAARQLIPYISDAVPGWFQATLALYDAAGKEVGYAGNYTFHQDPVLHYEVAHDGEYTLEIKDSIYRGREDFVYRITLGEMPFITGVFPLGGKTGAKTRVELTGWNLPKTRLNAPPPSVPFVRDTLPESMEKEPNSAVKNAQKLKLPVIVNGRIQQPGDTDIFRFEGRAGEEIVAEVMARRLDSPLDSILRLTDAAGKELALNDDAEDKSSAMLTHHADSQIQVKLPANGTYYLHLTDAQRKGGPLFAYRLRLSHPRPDYELRVVPASLNVRAASTTPITVYAIRRDGFAGEIGLRLKDAPGGFMLSGATIPRGQDKVRLTLTAPGGRVDKPVKLHLEGHATIDGKEARRAGIPAEDMMQAFYYHHLLPSADWMVRVNGAQRGGGWKPVEKRVQLPAGGSAPVEVFVPAGRFNGTVLMALNEAPEGLAIESIAQARDGFHILVTADKDKIKPGLAGNLIVEAYLERAGSPGTLNKRRLPLGMLPAIPFEIVAR